MIQEIRRLYVYVAEAKRGCLQMEMKTELLEVVIGMYCVIYAMNNR